MSVHYKFKSALDYDTVTFDGLHISVGDLKKSIMQQKKIGKVFDFDLQITNAQTKEVYTDDSCLIPKNASVIVSRVPNGNSSKKSWDRNDPSTLVSMVAIDGSEPIPFDRMTKSADLTSINVPEDEKIRAMMSQSTQDYDPSRYVKTKGMSGPIPVNYTCFRCGRAGHWIKNCPTNAADVKRSTGIPRSFMVTVEGPEVPGALLTSTGQYAVPMIDHEAYKEGKKERPPFAKEPTPEKEAFPTVPEELLCMICRDLLSDAVLIPCCGNSYCDECVRQALLDSEEHECPTCHEKDISPDTLIPNRFLRTAVMNFKNETGYTKLARKLPPPPPVEEPAVALAQPDSTSCNAPQVTETAPVENVASPFSLQEEDSKMSATSANTCDRPDTPVRDEKTSDALGDERACDSSLGNGEENSVEEPVSFAIATITTRGACPISATGMSGSPQSVPPGQPPPLMSSVPRLKILPPDIHGRIPPGIDPLSRPPPYGDDGGPCRPPTRDVTGPPIRLPPPIQRPDAPPPSYSAPISTGILGSHPSAALPSYTVPPPRVKPPPGVVPPPLPLLGLPTAQMLSRPPPQFPQNLRHPPPSLYGHPATTTSSLFRGPPPPLHHSQQPSHSQPLLRRPPSLPPPPPPGSVPPMQPLPPGIRPMHPPPPSLHHGLLPPTGMIPTAVMPSVSETYLHHHHSHPPPLGLPPHYQPRSDAYYRDHAGYPPSDHSDPYARHRQMYEYTGAVMSSSLRDDRRSRRRSRSRSRSSSSSKTYSRTASSRSRSRSRSSRSHSSRSRSRSYSHSGRSRSYSASLSRSRSRSPYAYHRRSRSRSTSRPTAPLRSRSRSKARHSRHSPLPLPSASSSSYHRRSRSRTPRRGSPISSSSSLRRHHREYSPDGYYGGSGGGVRSSAATAQLVRSGAYRQGLRGPHQRPAGIPPPPPANPAYDVHRDGRYHDAYHLYDGAYDYETAADVRYDVERYEEYYRAAANRHRRVWAPPPMVTPLLQHVEDPRSSSSSSARKTRDFVGKKPIGKKSPSPLGDHRDYRREDRSSRERMKDEPSSRSRDAREDRESDRRTTKDDDRRTANNKDDERRSSRGDESNHDRRNRDESRDEKRKDTFKAEASRSSGSSKQKSSDSKKSSSASSSKHESKESASSMKESSTASKTTGDAQQQQSSEKSKESSKEKRQHKRKGSHHGEEGTATPSKKTKTVKKDNSVDVEASASSSTTEVEVSSSNKKASKKKKNKVVVQTVQTAPTTTTVVAEPAAKSEKSRDKVIEESLPTMPKVLEVSSAVISNSNGVTKNEDCSILEPNAACAEDRHFVPEGETTKGKTVHVDIFQDDYRDVLPVPLAVVIQTVDVSEGDVTFEKTVANADEKMMVDVDVLTAPVPEISKWELYDVGSHGEEEDEDVLDVATTKQQSAVVGKKGLPADIVQRAEKAILQKVMKPAVAEPGKATRKVDQKTGSEDAVVEATAADDDDDDDDGKQIFEPTSFKGRDKSISIRLDRSKFVEKIREERPSSSQSASSAMAEKAKDVRKMADEGKTKATVDDGRSKKTDERAKKSSSAADDSKQTPRSTDEATTSRSSRRDQSKERADRHGTSSSSGRGDGGADDSRHASSRRSPRNRSRDRSAADRSSHEKRKQATKDAGSSSSKSDRSRTTTSTKSEVKAHHRPSETSSHRESAKSEKKASTASDAKKGSAKSSDKDRSGHDDRRKEKTTTDRRHLSIDESKFEPNYDDDIVEITNDSSAAKKDKVKVKAKDSSEVGVAKVVVETKKKRPCHSESSDNDSTADSKSEDDENDEDDVTSVDSAVDKKKSSAAAAAASALPKKSSKRKPSGSGSASDDGGESTSPDKHHSSSSAMKKHKKSGKHKKHKKHKHKKSKKARRNSKKESDSEGGSVKQSSSKTK